MRRTHQGRIPEGPAFRPWDERIPVLCAPLPETMGSRAGDACGAVWASGRPLLCGLGQALQRFLSGSPGGCPGWPLPPTWLRSLQVLRLAAGPEADLCSQHEAAKLPPPPREWGCGALWPGSGPHGPARAQAGSRPQPPRPGPDTALQSGPAAFPWPTLPIRATLGAQHPRQPPPHPPPPGTRAGAGRLCGCRSLMPALAAWGQSPLHPGPPGPSGSAPLEEKGRGRGESQREEGPVGGRGQGSARKGPQARERGHLQKLGSPGADPP